jgi:hypothetical protein
MPPFLLSKVIDLVEGKELPTPKRSFVTILASYPYADDGKVYEILTG